MLWQKKIPRRARDYEAAAILIAGDGLCKEFNGFDERTIAVAIEGTERPFGGDTSRKFPVMGGASGFIDGAVLTDFDIDGTSADRSFFDFGNPVEQIIFCTVADENTTFECNADWFFATLTVHRHIGRCTVTIFNHLDFIAEAIDVAESGDFLVIDLNLEGITDEWIDVVSSSNGFRAAEHNILL